MYGWISVNQHLEVNMSNDKQSSVEWFANESWQVKVQLDNQAQILPEPYKFRKLLIK